MSTLVLSTGGSRLLGLVRDVAFFSSFGTGLIASAFLMAFTLPNLFRRLLGEGALASAFIPVFSQNWNCDPKSGFRLLNQTLTRLLLYFGGGIALASILLLGFHHQYDLPEKWSVTLPMLVMLLPYAVMICMAAILTAALNVFGKFFLASLSPIFLNLAMISALLAGNYLFPAGSLSLAIMLCVGVLCGGLLQFLLPAAQLVGHQWLPQVNLQPSPELQRLRQLFLTATGGAAILQVNILVTRLIAYQHSDAAVSQLYLASRLTELPLGMFAVAIYTVLFPLLSGFAARADHARFSETCKHGILLSYGITMPAAVGLALLAQPIISVLFQWGKFTSHDVVQSAPVLSIYAASVPCYAIIALLTRVFHSRQEMRSPVQVSAIALVLNATLSIGLMIPFGVLGLASANVITSLVQLCLLVGLLRHRDWIDSLGSMLSPLLRMSAAAVFMGFCVVGLSWWLPKPATGEIALQILALGTHIATGVLSYALACWLMGLRSWFSKPTDRIS